VTDETQAPQDEATRADDNPYALTREQLIRTQTLGAVLGRAGEWRVGDTNTQSFLTAVDQIAQWVIDGTVPSGEAE
jgi:hypothetical protein